MRSGGNILVMGVCGVGKSTIARAIAQRIGGHFLEADSFHSDANVAAMSRGIPLTDDMRADWLDTLCGAVGQARSTDDTPVVMACSALKQRYRAKLATAMEPMFVVHLSGEPEVIRSRLLARKDHFMPPALLDSQLQDLEPLAAGEHGMKVDIALTPDVIVDRALSLIANGGVA